jgi:large subunit ribosomal protein L11
MELMKPPTTFFLKQAAGIKRGSMGNGQIAGILSIKHIYEIAKFKNEDINCAHLSIKQMCIKVIDAANSCGIKIVKHDLDPKELKEFLEERKEQTQKEIESIAEKRAAKLMRTAAIAAKAQ